MTSSFSNMVVAAQVLAYLDDLEGYGTTLAADGEECGVADAAGSRCSGEAGEERLYAGVLSRALAR